MATGAAGMAVAGTLAKAEAPAMTNVQKRSRQMEFSKSEAKQWAKKHYSGL